MMHIGGPHQWIISTVVRMTKAAVKMAYLFCRFVVIVNYKTITKMSMLGQHNYISWKKKSFMKINSEFSFIFILPIWKSLWDPLYKTELF